jgi:hypothetical protein
MSLRLVAVHHSANFHLAAIVVTGRLRWKVPMPIATILQTNDDAVFWIWETEIEKTKLHSTYVHPGSTRV